MLLSDSSKNKLEQQLIDNSLITEDQLNLAKSHVRRTTKPFEQVLVDLGFITDRILKLATAHVAEIEYFDSDTHILTSSLVQQIPKDCALEHKIIPISYDSETAVLTIAMADIYNVISLDQAKRYFPLAQSVVTLAATEEEILKSIELYHQPSQSLSDLFQELENNASTAQQTQPATNLVNCIIIKGIEQNASDIHFQPENQFVRLRYRIDGHLTQACIFHKEYWPAICVRLKVLSGMNVAESRKPQSGRITFKIARKEIDLRVSSHPTVNGENFVLRILDKSSALRPLTDLGFSQGHVEQLKKLLNKPQGIIVLTGPTGAGKTTTMYSILQHINSLDINIMTLEEPIEYNLPLIRQTQVHDLASTSFADGVRSILRQDPDVIFIGEVRDEDTAKMSLRAAMTGHRVFTTLHTNDSFGTVARFADLGISPAKLAGNVIASIAQRLVRVLCSSCKAVHTPTEQEAKLLKSADQIFMPCGCENCNFTGYKGRTAIVEILEFDHGFNELVFTNSSAVELKKYAISKGFKSLEDDGRSRILSGVTSISEICKVVDLS